MLQYYGYILTVLVGITLGMLGSGGSILTEPNLVYLFNVNPSQATTYSLFIIGISSIIGSVPKIKKKLVNYRIALIFGIPSILAMFFTRSIILPQIPVIIELPLFGVIAKEFVLLIAFALVMILAAYSMITNRQNDCIECGKKMEKKSYLLILQGIIIGFVSGIFGAGGGFLIIPGLVIFAKVPMKNAIATSLFLVAINSLVGFSSDFEQFNQLNFKLLWILSFLSIVGIMIGNKISIYISSEKIKPVFGYFILVVAGIIIFKEIVIK